MLASINDSLPLEVPIGLAALYRIAPRGAHKASNFLLLEEVLSLR